MFKRKKWDFIDEKLISEDICEADLDMLGKLSGDRDDFIRQEAADLLYHSDSPRAEQMLLGMLEDKCADVRSSVCRSLCISRSADTVEALKALAVSDEDILTRGYAVISIIEIAARIDAVSYGLADYLEQGLNEEKEPWVIVAYYYALYVAGKVEHLPCFLEGLNNDDYRIRCMTANLLMKVVNKENIDIIKAALKNRLDVEDTVAARRSIENALKELN